MNRATADESLVAQVAAQFVTVWNAHEMLRLEEIYAADADFVNVIGMRWKGSARIAQMHMMQQDSAGAWRIAVSQNTDIQDLPIA